tara:strand:+ start:659 stop:919 length:261 start_codon:yes stop_codon:yes gene_type:complete
MNISYDDKDSDETNQKIGEVMISLGLVSKDDLDDALIEQEIARRKGEEIMIGYVLVEMGVLTNVQLIEVYREYKRRLKFTRKPRRL